MTILNEKQEYAIISFFLHYSKIMLGQFLNVKKIKKKHIYFFLNLTYP